MAQERKIVPNLYTSGGEFVLRSKQQYGESEEYVGSFHYDIDEDKYYTYSTPELGLESSAELVPLDKNARDENGYLVVPYNVDKNYKLKLSRKKYEDVREVIDNRITELAPPEVVSPELTIEERIVLLKAEFSDLKEHMIDEDLDLLIRESLLESSQILVRGNTEEIVLSYFDIAHFGIEMKGTLSDGKGPHTKIEVNGTDVFEGDINHTDYRFYNFMIPIQQDDDTQKISITFDDDQSNDTGDRNLQIRFIKNKPITYHAYSENPDIFDDSTLMIPEVTSSQKDNDGNNLMIPATPFDEDNIFEGYKENIFYIENDTDKDTRPLYNYFTPSGQVGGAPDGAVEGSEILLYDKDGFALLDKYPNDPFTYQGKFKSSMPWNSQVQIKLPTNWFLSEYPSQPVEFTTDDFQIGTIKATKIDLIECMTKEQLQIDSVEALKQKIEEENEELRTITDDALAVSASQEAEINSLKSSIEMMSENYLTLWDGEDDGTGHNMSYNSRFTKSKDSSANISVNDKRPKYWYMSSGYDDANDGAPLAVWEYESTGGAPSSVSGYPGEAKGLVRTHYFPPGGTLSEEGWPNENQKIGFRMKANNYKGWPKVRLKDVKSGRYQTKTVNSYQWKTYWFDLNLADVGVENRNIQLHLAFINNAMKRGPWYKRGKYNNKTGKDRDVWISHIVREDGTMYATNRTNNPTMNDIRMRDNNGNLLRTTSNATGYQNHTAEFTDVNNREPWYYLSDRDLIPPQKFDNSSGIRFIFPANSELIFVKGEAGSPPPNKFAQIYCGGRGFADDDNDGYDDMNDERGIFVIPHKKYVFKFCARKAGSNNAVTYNGYTSDSVSGNTIFGAYIGDRRNGWRGSSNPYPGTEGYEWFESDQFDLAIDYEATEKTDPPEIITRDPYKWNSYEIEFEPRPGPQGGTKVYFGFYLHKGTQGEKNILEFSECRIVGPLADEEY